MRAPRPLAGAAVLAGCCVLATYAVTAQVNSRDPKIDIVDDCLPGDPAWDPTGGCTLKAHQGDVSAQEFNTLLRSPRTNFANGFLIGHPSWRNEPGQAGGSRHSTSDWPRRPSARRD